MLELPSLNRLIRIQSSDHILKHTFAVFLSILSTVVGLLRYTTLFLKVCPQKEVSRSQIGTSRWPHALRYDPIFKKFS